MCDDWRFALYAPLEHEVGKPGSSLALCIFQNDNSRLIHLVITTHIDQPGRPE